MPRTRWYQEAVISTSLQFKTMWSRRSTVKRMLGSDMKGISRRAYRALRHWRQFVMGAVLLSVSLPAWAQPYAVEARPNIAYGPLPAEQGDLYLPTMPTGRRPAVVIIHGGGWVSGSRHGDDYISNVLASLGVVVLNIDYRLADKTLPDTRWPAQLIDSQLAVRFLRAHAAEYAIDPARFGAIGDSAGAQLAVFLGELPTNVAGDEAGLYPQERPNVKAVVDQFGPNGSAQHGQLWHWLDRGDVWHDDPAAK